MREATHSPADEGTRRGAVLAAACLVMFFISSIALYSVVKKNLLAIHPDWESSLTWAFPVFQTVMAVTGIFAGRISDRIGPRKVVLAAAVCYGAGWFLSGTVSAPWQFYLYFSLIAGVGNGLGYNPALTTGQKWFIDRKGFASGITLAASTLGPAVLSPILASVLIPSMGLYAALRVLGVVFLVTIGAGGLLMRAPEPGWTPSGYVAPEGSSAHAGTMGDLGPHEMVATPRFWALIVTFACAATAGTLLVGSAASIAAVQLFPDPASTAAVAIGGTVVMVNTIANFVGRIAFGTIVDRIGGYRSLLVMLVITIAALALMSMSFTQGMFFVALALLGFGFGALLVIYPPLTGSIFGTTNLGVNYGIMFLGYAASTWISSPISSALFDASAGSAAYQHCFYGAIAIALVAVALTALMMVGDERRAAAEAREA